MSTRIPAQAHQRLVPALPAATRTESADQCAERPLKVCIRPRQLDFWEYEGTRAQLEAEGVIPPGTEWPEGAQDLRFDVGRFSYSLHRTRPDGVKGPMKVWTNGDWWRLRCDLIDGPGPASISILDKKRELAEAIYRQSPAGQAEWHAQWNRLLKSREDKAFQAFKAIFIPERKKPARRPKAAVPAVSNGD